MGGRSRDDRYKIVPIRWEMQNSTIPNRVASVEIGIKSVVDRPFRLPMHIDSEEMDDVVPHRPGLARESLGHIPSWHVQFSTNRTTRQNHPSTSDRYLDSSTDAKHVVHEHSHQHTTGPLVGRSI